MYMAKSDSANLLEKLWTYFDWMPEGASTWADEVDWVNNLITNISVFCTVVIVGAMLYFAVRYRRRGVGGSSVSTVTHSVPIETLWTAIPTIVCVYMFYYGLVVYKDMRTPPLNPIEINVYGYKWAWEFQHANGKRETGELVVPVGKPVRLVMTSRDVHHSFFIPAMRIKEDIIAGRYHFTWFEATRTGEFPVFCTEYCGQKHYNMLAKLRVVSEEEYEDYLLERGASGEVLEPSELGAKLYTAKGCNACHSLDGSKVIGPSWKALYGVERRFSDGSSSIADENYLRESILNPNKRVVEGFQPNLMVAWEGLLSEEELNGLIAYIKTLKE